MARIRATCPDCGDVELSVPQVEVRICTSTDAGEYVFCCPTCGDNVAKPAEHRTLDLLAASGVRVVTWTMPAERLVSPATRPISYDDIIDFHELLHDEAAMADAIGTLQNGR